MGFLEELIFNNSSSSKPRVTPNEWKKARSNLYSINHFTEIELNKVEEIFRGDMNEQNTRDNGIDVNELVKGIEYMRSHLNVHHISLAKIDALEIEMMKWIAKYE